MVFAEAGYLNIPDEDHLVVILFEDSVVYDVWAEGYGRWAGGRADTRGRSPYQTITHQLIALHSPESSIVRPSRSDRGF